MHKPLKKHSNCQNVIDLIFEKISEVKRMYPKCEIIFDYELVRNWYSYNDKDPLIKDIKNSIKKSWLKPSLSESFWVSDCNTLKAMWVKAVLIWMWIKWAHTVNETIELKSMIQLVEIIVNFVKYDLS